MRWTIAMIAMAAATPARADVVTLTSGERVEGRVTRTGDRITIEVDWGTMTVPASSVTRIELKPSVLQDYLERRLALGASDVAARVDLAAWARARELYAREREMWREVVAIEPDHAAARVALGYRKIDGRWMTDDEHQAAQGKVRVGSLWVTPAEAADMARREREEEAAAVRRAELDLSERRLAEARLATERAQVREEEQRHACCECRWHAVRYWTCRHPARPGAVWPRLK